MVPKQLSYWEGYKLHDGFDKYMIYPFHRIFLRRGINEIIEIPKHVFLFSYNDFNRLRKYVSGFENLNHELHKEFSMSLGNINWSELQKGSPYSKSHAYYEIWDKRGIRDKSAIQFIQMIEK